jgi:hypothetical protein
MKDLCGRPLYNRTAAECCSVGGSGFIIVVKAGSTGERKAHPPKGISLT